MADEAQAAQVDTTPIYDISGQQPVLGDIPHDQVQEAVASGKYSLPKGQEVSVVSPEGQFGTIPAEQAPDAFNSGYKYATPAMQSEQADQEKYGTTGQQVITGLEGAAQGALGPVAPLIERAVGVDPEDIRKRAEVNPKVHGVTEFGGFGAGMLTGASEAALLGKAGEAVAGGLGLLNEGASVGTRLAAGAAKMATEMGLFQAGDEATKVVLDAPNSPGQAAANVGLSALMGGALGVPLSALGIGAKAAINSQLFRDFSDRMAFRATNLNPNEMMQHELEGAVNSFHQIGDEVNGEVGLKAQALAKALPGAVTPEISSQIQSVSDKASETLQKMVEKNVPSRLIKDFQADTQKFLETATNPQASVDDHFDALNQFKNDIQDYSKGRYGLNAVQRTAEDYHFVNLTKDLGREVRLGLEDPAAWGKAADVQKSVNQAWKDSIPYVNQIEKTFMSKLGNDRVIDPQKFTTYMNQNGKATSETVRQQLMGKFTQGMDQFYSTVADIADKAGVDNPVQPVSMNALKESMGRQSVGAKLADVWTDKIGAHAMGNALGGGTGAVLGHATGIPEAGFAGAYLGRWVLGPVFGAMIKPLMENAADLPALRAGLSYSKAVLAGNAALTNAAATVFSSGSKTLPSHLMVNSEQIKKLDTQLKEAAADPKRLMNVAGSLGKVAPDHASSLTQTTATATNYLNSIRPVEQKLSPLDTPVPVTKAQKMSFERSLAIAQQPLSILQHIKDGTIIPQDTATLKTIYPSYYNKISSELVGSMSEHMTKGGTIPYHLRQSISTFLGQPLDSTQKQPFMASIMMANAPKAPVQQGSPKHASQATTKSTDKIASMYRTPGQDRQADKIDS